MPILPIPAASAAISRSPGLGARSSLTGHPVRRAVGEHEPDSDLGAEDAGFAEQPEHHCRCPAVERRWQYRDEDEVCCEERGAHQPGDARRPVDDDVIDAARQLGRVAMECIACEPDRAEQTRQALRGALFGPVER